MSAQLTMLGGGLGHITSHAQTDAQGRVVLTAQDDKLNHCGLVLSRAEAAKIMADLATAMGLIEAPKVAA